MTYAPDSIKAARSFLVAHLDIHPSSGSYAADLDPAEVGIVGDTGHAATGTSYHLGKDQLRSDSYSIIESSRDKKGLTNAAAALDIGSFSITVGGKVHTQRTLAAWLVAQCKAGTADTKDIREIIYSLDGQTVHRWDRLGKRTSGDSSHLYHDHLSYFRDSESRDKTALFRRYLTEIGLLGGDDVNLSDKVNSKAYPGRTVEQVFNDVEGLRDTLIGDAAGTKAAAIKPTSPIGRVLAMPTQLDQVLAAVKALTGKDFTDEAAIIDGVLAGLSPEKVAAAIPADMAAQVVDLLTARLAA